MKQSSLHTKVGLIMAIPILLWAITGFIFLTKPGYKDAYEQLTPKQYPLEQSITIPESANWSEVKVIKTILGHHLLVISDGKPLHLNPIDFSIAQTPTNDQLLKLINDSTSHNHQRYGDAISIADNKITTDTGVVISLDWNTLKLRQQGSDTRLINTLYKIHYLQWLGETTANKVFGGLGLLLLITLLILGINNYLRRRT